MDPEINALIFLTLISAPFIMRSVNFHDLNFHYFGFNFAIRSRRSWLLEKSIIYLGGSLSVSLKLRRTFEAESTMNVVSV